MSGMEGDDHQRPQYEHQQYASGYPQNLRPNVRGSSGAERFGQAQMMSGRGPTSASVGSMTGAQHQEVGNYGYAQGSQYQPAQVQSSSLHFPATYQPDLQRSQNVPQYTSQVAYNVPQQQQPRSPYDPMPQYQPRQSAALEVLSNQFGVPQYYPGGEPIGVAAQTSPAQQYAPSHFQQSLPYQAPGIGRGPASTAYPSGMAEYPHSSMQEMVEHPQPETSSHDEEYQKYQEAVRQVFEDASRGRLVEAAQSLLEISEWLRGHAKDLGLASDNQGSRTEHLRLWNEFNLCWLAVLQRQKDDTHQMIDSGQPPGAPQNLLPEAFLERMAEALVSLCDGMEKYGLVDYQMGVWEEEIMSILTQCLDLLQGDEASGPEGGNVGPQMQQSPTT